MLSRLRNTYSVAMVPPFSFIYRGPGFKCVVKRLRIALCKADCNSNDCEVPNKQNTPPTLAREVWPVRLQEEEIVKKIYINSVCFKQLCISGSYNLTVDLSMSIIDNNPKLDRILDSMTLDKNELTDLPM